MSNYYLFIKIGLTLVGSGLTILILGILIMMWILK